MGRADSAEDRILLSDDLLDDESLLLEEGLHFIFFGGCYTLLENDDHINGKASFSA